MERHIDLGPWAWVVVIVLSLAVTALLRWIVASPPTENRSPSAEELAAKDEDEVCNDPECRGCGGKLRQARYEPTDNGEVIYPVRHPAPTEALKEKIEKLTRWGLAEDNSCGDPECCGWSGGGYIEASIHGEYVRLDDIQALFKEAPAP